MYVSIKTQLTVLSLWTAELLPKVIFAKLKLRQNVTRKFNIKKETIKYQRDAILQTIAAGVEVDWQWAG